MYPGSQMPSLLSKRQTEENINASILVLLARRMREGYTVDVRNETIYYLNVDVANKFMIYFPIRHF